MDPSHLLAFAVLAFALIVVPGPSVLFVVGRSLAHGRRVALATVVGNAAGEYALAVAVAAGLGVVVEQSDAVFTAMKLLGAAYLAYLGLRTIARRRELDASRADAARPGGGRALWDGFAVGVTNPKTVVFFAAVLPQFVDPSAGPAAVQMLELALLFVAIALVSDTAWALAASGARDWFARSPGRLAAIRAGSGAVMVGLAARLALADRRG